MLFTPMPFLHAQDAFTQEESSQDLCFKITRIMAHDEFLSMLRRSSIVDPDYYPSQTQRQTHYKILPKTKKLTCQDSRVIIEILNLNKCHFFSPFLSATLGGNFGLFLGMSILTLLEFVDFALRRFCVFIWNESQTMNQA